MMNLSRKRCCVESVQKIKTRLCKIYVIWKQKNVANRKTVSIISNVKTSFNRLKIAETSKVD